MARNSARLYVENLFYFIFSASAEYIASAPNSAVGQSRTYLSFFSNSRISLQLLCADMHSTCTYSQIQSPNTPSFRSRQTSKASRPGLLIIAFLFGPPETLFFLLFFFRTPVSGQPLKSELSLSLSIPLVQAQVSGSGYM